MWHAVQVADAQHMHLWHAVQVADPQHVHLRHAVQVVDRQYVHWHVVQDFILNTCICGMLFR
jgi:hypothetical protein